MPPAVVVPRPVLKKMTSMASVDEVAAWTTIIPGKDDVACTKTLYEVVTPVAPEHVACAVVVAVMLVAAMVQ